MVSGTLSLLCKRCFSPFPHGTCSLSVSGECLALADGPAGFTQGSTCPALLRSTGGRGRLRVRGCHPLRPDFPDCSARLHHVPISGSYNPVSAETDTVWALPRSLATTGGITFVFSSCGYSDVSVHRVRLRICMRMTGLRPAGSPHSDTGGSQAACASPPIFAACRVLHRLPEPRHPPCALSFFRRRCFPGTPKGGQETTAFFPRRPF